MCFPVDEKHSQHTCFDGFFETLICHLMLPPEARAEYDVMVPVELDVSCPDLGLFLFHTTYI